MPPGTCSIVATTSGELATDQRKLGGCRHTTCLSARRPALGTQPVPTATFRRKCTQARTQSSPRGFISEMALRYARRRLPCVTSDGSRSPSAAWPGAPGGRVSTGEPVCPRRCHRGGNPVPESSRRAIGSEIERRNEAPVALDHCNLRHDCCERKRAPSNDTEHTVCVPCCSTRAFQGSRSAASGGPTLVDLVRRSSSRSGHIGPDMADIGTDSGDVCPNLISSGSEPVRAWLSEPTRGATNETLRR